MYNQYLSLFITSHIAFVLVNSNSSVCSTFTIRHLATSLLSVTATVTSQNSDFSSLITLCDCLCASDE